MQSIIHDRAALLHAAPEQQLKISILIGNVQTGQWWIRSDNALIQTGTVTETEITIDRVETYYGKLLRIEVRCDDTNPDTDNLSSTIKVSPVDPPFEWTTNNQGQQEAHAFMTSVARIFVIPVHP